MSSRWGSRAFTYYITTKIPAFQACVNFSFLQAQTAVILVDHRINTLLKALEG